MRNVLLVGHHGGPGLSGQASLDEGGLPVLGEGLPEGERIRLHQKSLNKGCVLTSGAWPGLAGSRKDLAPPKQRMSVDFRCLARACRR